jgi:zinc protease
MEDLDAASLNDVREWFRTYYGASNATVVVAGDVDPEHARQRVEHFFGSVPPGPPVSHPERLIAPMGEPRRLVARDRVPQARIYKTWNIPQWGTREGELLDLVADVLGGGRTSRLYRRLVYEDEIATQVSASASLLDIGGQFHIQATARPGQELAEVERAIDEELARLLEDGPEAAEVERVKTEHFASFTRGIERIGGFGGKSDVLAACQVYVGDPGCYRDRLRWVREATVEDLQEVARAWLGEGVFALEVHPYPDYRATASTVDRSRLPAVSEFPDAAFPPFTTSTLPNGLEVVLAERPGIPVVNFTLMVDAGYAADQHSTPGTASLTAAMLDQGTETRSALEIAEEASRLGARIGSGANVDVSIVSLSALRQNLDASVELFADVVRNPSFPESDFRRLQQERLAQIQREKVTPLQMALRVMPPLLFGSEHAYGQPLTGSGTEDAVAGLERDDLAAFHDTWYRASNATVVVVGDVSMPELRPILDRHFGAWTAGDMPEKDIEHVAQPTGTEIYLMDRPDSQQSIIFAGQLAPPKANPEEVALGTVNDILGGSFSSRINMNLREEKGWSYGAFSMILDAEGQRPFFAYAPVQTDRTAESVQELLTELRGMAGEDPMTAEELERSQANQTRSLPGRWETNAVVGSDLAQIVRFGLPHDYWDTYADAVRSLDLERVRTVASEVLRPHGMVWVIVGDLSEIEEPVRALDLGPVRRIDADGRLAEAGTR